MFIPKSSHVFALDKNNAPVAKVALPYRLTFETLDCFSEQINCPADTIETLDFNRVNPATGPVYLEGVKAGDIIAVNIRDIRVKSPGKIIAAPGAGILGSLVRTSETVIVPIAGDKALFKGLELPLNPMIGVIGVAPAGDPVPCGTPGPHGGNMDTKTIAAGSTLYLPVQVDGGLLGIGDLHAVMNDGEIMVSGVEVSGEVDVTISKVENLAFTNPLLKTGTELSCIASAGTLDAAVERAIVDMAKFLESSTDLTLNQAGMLMSAVGCAEISQVVDPLKTARFSMPLAILQKLGVSIAF